MTPVVNPETPQWGGVRCMTGRWFGSGAHVNRRPSCPNRPIAGSVFCSACRVAAMRRVMGGRK